MRKLIILLLLSPNCFAGSEQEAIEKATEAWAKYSGADKRIETMVRDKIPKEYEPVIGYFGSIVGAIQQKKVIIKWEW